MYFDGIYCVDVVVFFVFDLVRVGVCVFVVGCIFVGEELFYM